jgi:hypothetical protein
LIAKSLTQLLQSQKKEKPLFFALITLGTVMYRDFDVKTSISTSEIATAIQTICVNFAQSASLMQACQDMQNIIS